MSILKDLGVFQRERVPHERVMEAVLKVVAYRLSYRHVAREYRVSHQAVWYWVSQFRRIYRAVHRRAAAHGLPELILVDETEVPTTQGTLYLWVALDPWDKTVLGLAVTKGRSLLECQLVFQTWFRWWHARPKAVLTDKGRWYGVLDRLGVRWVQGKGIRSLVERVIRTLKEHRWLTHKRHCTCRVYPSLGPVTC
jgi:transposase-like protein